MKDGDIVESVGSFERIVDHEVSLASWVGG